KIVFLEINRSEKVVGVVIVRFDGQSMAQFVLRSGKVFFLIGDPGEFLGKARVAGSELIADKESCTRLFPSLQVSQSQAAIEQQIHRLRRAAGGVYHGVPVFALVEIFDFGQLPCRGILHLRKNAERKQQKQQEENQPAVRGTARSVQYCVALHSVSNPSRER